MSKVEKIIHELLQNHPKGFDLSLQRITALLKKLDDPHLKLPPVFHIAGTNGKGSTTAFLRALLEAADYKVHVHTSPHLVKWHERFLIATETGAKPVGDDLLANILTEISNYNKKDPITVFEIVTVAAFILFSRIQADAVILEVGLGGRFDATNVIEKTIASIITPISLDHQTFLGDTVGKIAFEKAGIIKESCPVIVGPQMPQALEVIEDQAQKMAAPISIFGQDFSAFLQHGRMVFQNEHNLYDLKIPALKGYHQITNAATALQAILQAKFPLQKQHIEDAWRKVYWPARLQKLPYGELHKLVAKDTEIILDGGHNPAAGEAIAQFLEQNLDPRPLILIVGMLNTKDNQGFLKYFKKYATKLYTIPIENENAVPAPILAQMAQKINIDASDCKNLSEALLNIQKNYKNPRILITGSLYLAGEVLQQNGTPPYE